MLRSCAAIRRSSAVRERVARFAGTWVQPFLDECETWPNGPYMDQVDAAVGAFNRLIKRPYSTNYSLWL